MKVTNCGYDFRENSTFHVERLEGVGAYLLLIIRSPACVVLNEQEHHIIGNNVIVYRAGTPQYFSADKDTFINDWVRFDLDDDDLALCEKLGIPFDTILEFMDVYELSMIVKQLFLERLSKNPNTNESKLLLLRFLLLKLSDLIYRENTAYTRLTVKLITLRNNIQSNPQKDWSLDSICKNLSISRSYLCNSYKKLFGNSIRNDVIVSRVELGKHLLSDSDFTISTIAHRCGYENDIHFMYIFKKKTGLTPSEYRKASHIYIK